MSWFMFFMLHLSTVLNMNKFLNVILDREERKEK